ncbi:MAG: exodeoxyribonuclease V subunit alpha [Deltaproteobacteria bacterium]|nr:exodeoxyribonuclease V subunit alpha [Deltaproteobacteria bacterium]
MDAAESLRALRSRGLLTDLDVHFAGLLRRLGEDTPEVLLAAALASRATGEGHVCVSLADAAEDLAEVGAAPPAPDAWGEVLRASRAVGAPGEFRPLVLDGAGRLYLYRYFAYERDLAEDLAARAAREPGAPDLGWAKEALGRFFPRPPSLPPEEPDAQKLAAAVTLMKSLCVLSGGPGTGKTTTVVRILALLQEQAGDRPLRVALAAPTGKAAARLQEAVRGARAGLPCAEAVRRAIPEEASTLHRLLGSRPGSPEFRHGRENPLPHDVVVVDEVSMVDLALMAKLTRALRPEARLILLGDRDQLASVEAGAVLGDLCDTGRDHGYSEGFARTLEELTGKAVGGTGTGNRERGTGNARLRDCLALLRWSYRFGGSGGIGAASRAVNEGRSDDALSALSVGGQVGQVGWRPAPTPAGLAAALEERVTEAFGPGLRAADPSEAFRSFARFRILCGRREGPYGVAAVNRAVENGLSRRGLLEPGREWYAGRPVLVTRNDYGLRLYNGDVGLALPDAGAGGALRVFFVAADGGVRRLAPLRLPACETAYAMTVHRSQGSEFEEVLLLLGAHPSRVLTRELVYTGLTRARSRVEVWGTEEVLRAAVRARTRRASGLRDALWGPDGAGEAGL